MSTEKTELLDTICKKSSSEEEPLSPKSPVWEDLIKIRNYFSPLPEKIANKFFGTDAEKNWTFKDGGGGPSSSVQFADIQGQPTDNAALATKLSNIVTNLTSLVNGEKADRQSADTAESTARTNADNAEKSAREAADTTEKNDRIAAVNAEKSAREAADTTINTAITNIQNVLPTGATATDPLTKMSDVTALVSTSEATYRGNCATYAELQTKTGMDKNDIAIVNADETHSGETWKYQYDGTAWQPLYKQYNVTITPTQQTAIDSGINATKVGNYDAHIANKNNPHETSIEQTIDTIVAGKFLRGSDDGTGIVFDTPQGKVYSAGDGINIDTTDKISLNDTTKTKLENLDNHIADTITNPHNVKIAETLDDMSSHAGQYLKVKSDGTGVDYGNPGGGGGTYSAGSGIAISTGNVISVESTTLGKIENANNHLSNKSNPHDVTATQVGAVKLSDYTTKITELETSIAAKAKATDLTAEVSARTAGDATTLTDAKSYTDGQLTSYAKTSDLTAETTARTNGDATTLTNAKSYTDTKVSGLAAQSDLDTEVSNRQTGDVSVLSNAKSYTDTKVNDEKTERQTADTATLNDAKTYTDTQIAGLSFITQKVVSTLPATGQTHVQYLVPVAGTTDKYSIHIDEDGAGTWRTLGTTEVDLSDYYTKSQVDDKGVEWAQGAKTYIDNGLANKQNNLTTLQLEAVNSGITETKRLSYDDHTADTDNPHNVTVAQTATTAQLAAINSGLAAADKTKLDGIESGANKTVVDSALSSTSTNPLENKAINAALSGKANATHNHTVASSTADGFMSSTDKSKLDGYTSQTVIFTLADGTTKTLNVVTS